MAPTLLALLLFAAIAAYEHGVANAFSVHCSSNCVASGRAAAAPSSSLSSSSSNSPISLFMSDNDDVSPSDSSDDDFGDGVVTVESQAFTPTETESLVTNIMDLLPTQNLGVSMSNQQRSEFNEVLLKLESLNPNPKQTTTSPLINGVWELKYAGGYTTEGAVTSPTRQLALFAYSGGYSPGLLALTLAKQLPSQFLSVGDLEISISREQPRVEATVQIMAFGSSTPTSTVKVQANLEVESDVRLRETYEKITIMDRVIDLPNILQYSRELYVTYVDEDLLIVRDASGVPELLLRKEKTFSRDWGSEPDMNDNNDDQLPATD